MKLLGFALLVLFLQLAPLCSALSDSEDYGNVTNTVTVVRKGGHGGGGGGHAGGGSHAGGGGGRGGGGRGTGQRGRGRGGGGMLPIIGGAGAAAAAHGGHRHHRGLASPNAHVGLTLPLLSLALGLSLFFF